MRVTVMSRTVAFLLLVSLPAWGSLGPGERERRPPREAHIACQGKNEGDSVEVTTPRGNTLKAVCRKLNGELAAMPEKMQPPAEGEIPRGEKQ